MVTYLPRMFQQAVSQEKKLLTDLSDICACMTCYLVTVAVQNGSLERSCITTIILDTIDLRLGEVAVGKCKIHQRVRTKALSEVHEVCVGQMGLEQNNDVELPNCSG